MSRLLEATDRVAGGLLGLLRRLRTDGLLRRVAGAAVLLGFVAYALAGWLGVAGLVVGLAAGLALAVWRSGWLRQRLRKWWLTR